ASTDVAVSRSSSVLREAVGRGVAALGCALTEFDQRTIESLLPASVATVPCVFTTLDEVRSLASRPESEIVEQGRRLRGVMFGEGDRATLWGSIGADENIKQPT